jgi:hypothetical protein
LPLQHPFEHEVASHTHAPDALHACPCEQALHDAPATPQVATPDFWHWPEASQHPVGQEAGVHAHTPDPLHTCPA